MRILGRIPHPVFQIVAYELERHYYLEIEAGPMKQCFKLPKDRFAGLEGLSQLIDPELEKGLEERFEAMYAELKRMVEV